MREAYRRTRKDGATGIDGVTAAHYEKDLEANLESLLDRIKSGRYIAPPVRRHYIPKADGTKRPLGIPTFEDVRLPRLHPRLGAVETRQGRRSSNHGERPLRPRAQIGTRMVQEIPAPADQGAAGTPYPGDTRPLRILRSDREWQMSRVVPLPARPHLAEVACTPQPPRAHELGPDERTSQAIFPAASHDHALMANLLE